MPSQLEFEAPEDATSAEIKSGKYFINNITGTPKEAFPDGPRVNIKNVDVDVFTKDTWQALPNWNIYQDYCTCDLISNERFGIKFIYFEGGYPISAWINENGTDPSGDFLFQYFCSIGNKSLRPEIGYFNAEDDEMFGACYTESLKVKFNYDFQSKTLTLSGNTQNDRYNCTMYTKMSTLSGIEQGLILANKPIHNNSIKFNCIRKFDINYQKINKYFDYTENIEILNSISTEKEGWKHNKTPITFILQTPKYKKKIKQLKSCIQKYWDNLQIYPCDYNGNRIESNINQKYKFYKLACDNIEFNTELSAFYKTKPGNKFNSQLDTLDIDTTNINLFLARQETIFNNKEYTVIVNKQLYFVLSDDDIYDWGIILIPRFSYLGAPVFKSTIKNGQLIYGLGMNGNVSPAIQLR